MVQEIHSNSQHQNLILPAVAASVATMSADVSQTLVEVSKIKDTVLGTHQQLETAGPILYRGLDPTKDQPITLEDSTGSFVPIPLEWIEWIKDWGVSHP